MKKIVFFIISILIILVVGFAGYSFFLSKTNERGALQVTSEPESIVYLDGKEIGKTPLCICGLDIGSDDTNSSFNRVSSDAKDMLGNENLLPIGEYTIRLVPTDKSLSEFQDKITIGKSVLTVVDRTFGKGAASDGSVIMLEKTENDAVELSVATVPDGANVFLDGQSNGKTPLMLSDITESDHELEFSKSGYRDKGVRIKTVKGYRLIARIYLGVDEAAITGKEKSQSEDTQEKKDDKEGSENALEINSVTILETGTGFLRVRDSASLAGSEVGRVTPGEKYPLLSEQENWFQIEYEDGKTGWISSQFAKKSDASSEEESDE